MGSSLAEIITGCQKGDREAQRQLYERYHRKVFQLVVQMVGPQDALDLSQQIFLRIFQSIDQFSGRSRLETWLHRLTVNECLQHLRRHARRQHESLEEEPAVDSSDHTEHKELVGEALSRLEPELRAVLLLRELEGLSYHEIGEALELLNGTVGSRLNRARERLKRHLLELGWET